MGTWDLPEIYAYALGLWPSGLGIYIRQIARAHFIKTSGSKSRPRKVELASARKKHDDYHEYFTHNNKACKNHYKTNLPH